MADDEDNQTVSLSRANAVAVPVDPAVLLGVLGRSPLDFGLAPNEPAFDRVTLRRDEQRGWWVFDAGHAQLVFRDGDLACVMPHYVHVMSSCDPRKERTSLPSR